MEHIVLVIHLILTLVLIILIMLQRSEGGGLGLGTGGGLGNVASAQSTANALTKATAFVGAGFFITSLILAVMAAHSGGSSKSILDAAKPEAVKTEAPAVPQGDAAAPTPAPAQAKGDAQKDAQKTEVAPAQKETAPKSAKPKVQHPSEPSSKSEPKVPVAN